MPDFEDVIVDRCSKLEHMIKTKSPTLFSTSHIIGKEEPNSERTLTFFVKKEDQALYIQLHTTPKDNEILQEGYGFVFRSIFHKEYSSSVNILKPASSTSPSLLTLNTTCKWS